MTSPSALLEQTTRRLVQQRRVNICGFFLSLMVLTAVGCHLLFSVLLSPAWMLLPLGALSGLLIHRLVRARRALRREDVAALLDEKTAGQERFLTYATFPLAQEDTPFFSLLQRQAARKAGGFDPAREVPLTVERRVLLALSAAVVSIALLFVLPPVSVGPLFSHQKVQEDAVARLERRARELLAQEEVEAQAVGVQLLALVEELKNPALSLQDKQRLIEEVQQRLQVKLPLPQLLPFDLRLFASDSDNTQQPGASGDRPQTGDAPLAKSDRPQEHQPQSPSAAAGKTRHSGPPQEGNSQQSAQPRASGGGVRFNFPPPQSGTMQEQTGGESAGQQASFDRGAVPQGQGADPQRPGGQQAQGQGSDMQRPYPGLQGGQQGAGTTVGGAPGERFLQPGEERPGGFLTKDAQFVKVRVPAGQDVTNGGKPAPGRGNPIPKTPYSNTPLKRGTPDRPQPQQPIPLEYRAILQP